MGRAFHAMNTSDCLQLGLHEDSVRPSDQADSRPRLADESQTYAGFVDDIEAESYLRMWWAVYSGDRSSAITENGKLFIREEETLTLKLPCQLYSLLLLFDSS
jgi:hypothetical protein